MTLETKLQPPGLKPQTLRRERLLKLLKNNLERKLILITGNAGYGKTTLLVQGIQDAHLPGVFYELDRSDSDFSVFFSYLVHGLEILEPELVQRTRILLERGEELGENHKLALGTLINELVEKRQEELFFLLDDYHSLSEESLVHRALDYFIDHLPDSVHFVIASRTIPPFPSLARWRAKGDLFELSREDLRFTEDEVKALLSEIFQLALSEHELNQVIEKTEGWITGIRLILQSAGRDGQSVKETLNGYLEANQPLFDYFASEILSGEPAGVQEFLEQSAILEVLTPEACDAVLERRGSEGLLKAIEKRSLFLFAVGKGQYKHHRLFREFLLDRTRTEEPWKGLHLRAAAYFRQKGEWDRAIEHDLEAKNFAEAGKAIARVGAGMEEQARFSTLRGWIQRLPQEVCENNPRLLVLQGKLAREQGQLQKAGEFYLRAEHRLKVLGGRSSDLAEIAYLRGSLLWTMGCHQEALRTLRRASQSFPMKDPVILGNILNTIGVILMDKGELERSKLYFRRAQALFKGQNLSSYVSVSSNLAMVQMRQGKNQEAFLQYRQLIEGEPSTYFVKIGTKFGNAARIALNFGQEAWAERILNRGWELCRPYEDPWSHMVLHLGSGGLAMQKEQWDLAQEHFERALQAAVGLGFPAMESTALRDLIRLHRYRRDYDRAAGYLAEARQKSGSTDSVVGAHLLAESGLLEVSGEHWEKAEEDLTQCLILSQRYGWKAGEFLVRLGRAEISLSRGREKEAERFLSQAVRLARLTGYEGFLARELHHSPRLADLAHQVSGKRSPFSARLKDILKKGEATSGTIGRLAPLRVQLFGGFELTVHRISKTSQLKRRTTRAILAYFLLHPKESVTWEEIASWAWPESAPSAANKLFRNALWEIRNSSPALRSAILYRDNRYVLNPELGTGVDVWEFQGLLQQASCQTEEAKKAGYLEEANGLYQGPLLSGFYFSWADDLRNAMEEQYVQSLGSLAMIFARAGEYGKSVIYCNKYLEIDDLDEKIHRLLIANHARLGNKSKALKHYELLKKILRRNFGTLPSPETTALIET